jgi:hypothetical protein
MPARPARKIYNQGHTEREGPAAHAVGARHAARVPACPRVALNPGYGQSQTLLSQARSTAGR